LSEDLREAPTTSWLLLLMATIDRPTVRPTECAREREKHKPMTD